MSLLQHMPSSGHSFDIYINMYIDLHKYLHRLQERKKPTALSIPRRSPIQVLTQPYVA